MHLLRHLIAFSLLLGSLAQAVVVYKWTDQNGVVHFSDQPVPGAEKITTGIPNTGHLGGTGTATQTPPPPAPPKAPPRLGYTAIAIASPVAEQTFFDNSVPVRLELSPDLQSSHTLNWYLNGTLLDTHQNDTQFLLDSLARGSYNLVATITDPDTQESASSPPVTFYVHQASLLSPQHPKP